MGMHTEGVASRKFFALLIPERAIEQLRLTRSPTLRSSFQSTCAWQLAWPLYLSRCGNHAGLKKLHC